MLQSVSRKRERAFLCVSTGVVLRSSRHKQRHSFDQIPRAFLSAHLIAHDSLSASFASLEPHVTQHEDVRFSIQTAKRSAPCSLVAWTGLLRLQPGSACEQAVERYSQANCQPVWLINNTEICSHNGDTTAWAGKPCRSASSPRQ